MKCGIALSILVGIGEANAQSRADNWHFGEKASVRFTASGIQALTSSQLHTLEGTASISNLDGELLFYSEGDSVWNRDHVVMPNGAGLNGHPSATQSAVICPQPSDDDRYYIFTVDQQGQSNGLQYSIVDMTLDGGLGDIDSNYKNIPILSPVCEKVTASAQCDRGGYWIFTRSINNNSFIAFSLDENGLDTVNSIESTSPIFVGSPGGQGIGYMKASPDSRLLASCNFEGAYSNIELFKIQPGTGELINPLILPVVQPNGDSLAYPYGVEFSPSSRYLYVSGEDHIYQFDLEYYDLDSILNSKKVIFDADSGYVPTALQLAPDGRIYFNHGEYLSVIENPDGPDSLLNLLLFHVDLSGKNSGLGLPNIPTLHVYNPLQNGVYCITDSVLYTYDDSCANSITWNFDDPASGALNTSSNWNVKHLFSDTGTYHVRLIVEFTSRVDTFWSSAIVVGLPLDDPSTSLTLCQGDSAEVVLDSFNVQYKWSDLTIGHKRTFSQAGTFTVTATNACGMRVDSILVEVDTNLQITHLKDTSLCANQNALIESGTKSRQWRWSTGDTTSFITLDTSLSPYLSPIDIWLIASNACGSDSDTMTLSFIPLPDAGLPTDSVQCYDAPVSVLRADQDSTSYTWFDGTSDLSKLIDQDTIVWLIAYNVCGSDTDSMRIQFHPAINVELGKDTFLCDGDSVVLDASWPQASYNWTPGGSTDSVVTVHFEDLEVIGEEIYVVSITEGPCTIVESRKVSVQEEQCDSVGCKFVVANVFTPNGDGINDVLRISNACEDLRYRVSIYNRWGQLVFFGRNGLSAWDGFVHGVPASEGTYYVVIEDQGGSVQRHAVTLIR